METLPNEIVTEILLGCDANDILHFGKSCKRFAPLCHNVNWWNIKSVNEFKQSLPTDSHSTPYELYRRNQMKYYMSSIPPLPSRKEPSFGICLLIRYGAMPCILPDGSVIHF